MQLCVGCLPACLLLLPQRFCRNEARVQQAVRQVEQAGSSSGGSARGYIADLSSLAAVRHLADQVRQDCPRLDVLINNAGVYEKQLRKSQASRGAAGACWLWAHGGKQGACAAVSNCNCSPAALPCTTPLMGGAAAVPCCRTAWR